MTFFLRHAPTVQMFTSSAQPFSKQKTSVAHRHHPQREKQCISNIMRVIRDVSGAGIKSSERQMTLTRFVRRDCIRKSDMSYCILTFNY